MRETSNRKADRRMFKRAIVATITQQQVLDDQLARLAFWWCLSISNSPFVVVLMHRKPNQALGLVCGAEWFDVETGIHHLMTSITALGQRALP